MNNQAIASVIVPVLNGEHKIQRCIESLLCQSINDYEIIVVDNGSTDKTCEILKQFGNRIRFFAEPKKGSYHARNKGILHAKSQLLLFTDSDCIADANWIKELVTPFKDKKIIIVSGPVFAYKKDSILLNYCNTHCHQQRSYARLGLSTTANMAVRASVMPRFDGDLISGGDFVLCKKLLKNVKYHKYCAKAKVYHNYSDSFLRFLQKNYIYGKWNQIIQKRYGYSIIIKDSNEVHQKAFIIHYSRKLAYHAGKFIGFFYK